MRTKLEVVTQDYGTETVEQGRALARKELYDTQNPPLDQWFKLKLPYKALDSPDIPSMADIEQGMKHSLLTRSGGCFQVCRIGNLVVKCGTCPRIIQEAENMLFLREHSQVRVPKVYAAFIDPFFVDDNLTTEVFYLVMEFIEGITLTQFIFQGLDEKSQMQICSSLGDQFQLLRSVPAPPEKSFGRIYHQGINPRFALTCSRCKEMAGPYNTYSDLISAMHTSAEWDLMMRTNSLEFTSKEAEFLSQFKPSLEVTEEHKPVLTYLDPRFENMIARPITGDDGEVKDWEVTLIDWDLFFWMPVWMQCAALLERIWFWTEESNLNGPIVHLPELRAKFHGQTLLIAGSSVVKRHD
ncbi:uncharacterized protein K460DRAFT_354394 [Cucurbitaria berberidis CBS 394.84]|uniref:Aminoglycoside phosphotransferase domain-containing protein n=1 Tax=Cucurbitaria berberidis CBS 394.84 TaxID=1168544 RepID=A0A9P4GFZ9_9PLEO|nr:uncharacterized protein K460DRAFT_354394 [Cucurbitaria berberidis CBS 394.84]KAF1844480.1 hypothetical protein K460DRAFT_354394 [Cucurbitaria berberidis CBS 394.84]